MKQDLIFRSLSLSFLMSLAMSSCGVRTPKNSSSISNSNLSSIVYNPTRWAEPQAIPVCFLNQSELAPELVNDLKATLVAEYHQRTNIRFARFDDCTTGDLKSLTVRVLFRKVYDWDTKGSIQAGGGLSFIGPNPGELGGESGSSSLRVDIGTSGQYPVVGHPLRLFAINQTRAAFVHEMGHALGLAHEHERADAPKCNDMQGSLANDSTWVFVGDYDPNSIMNYCRNYTISTLSAGDIAGIGYLYPKALSTQPAPGLYTVNARVSARCLDSKGVNAQLEQWDCSKDSASSQIFRLTDGGAGSYFLQNEKLGSCLTVAAAAESDGAKVVVDRCQQANHQRVYLEATTDGYYHVKFAHTNKCLNVSDKSMANGADITQWNCHADSNQDFRLDSPTGAVKR